MKWTILGSGGCAVIPKPLCQCKICRQARKKGIPYSRAGPATIFHDINLLIDTPAEIVSLLNRSDIRNVDYLMLSHLDPDHVEGLRVVEQIALDFRTWSGCPQKKICLLLPEELRKAIYSIHSQYGPLVDFYQKSGFIELNYFRNSTQIEDIIITSIPVDRGNHKAFVYVFENPGGKVVYASCDIKPFPLDKSEVHNPDILIIQPGIFEKGLKHRFRYPADHISRRTLYTFEQTMELASQLNARNTIFVHLEEYWNRSYDDYCILEKQYRGIRFAYDGMELFV